MNKFVITAGIITLTAMGQVDAQKKDTDRKVPTQQTTAKETKTIEKAKTWITRMVSNTLNKANGLAENTNEEADGKHKEIYTDQYMAYKNDAMEAGMKGKMTLKEFKKKWAKDFNCEYAGTSTGYLVANTDYGFIEVIRCVFIKKIGTAYLFETIIRDTDAKVDYKRELKVIPSGNTFLIADVLEYH